MSPHQFYTHPLSNSVTLKIHVHFEAPISILTRKAKNFEKGKLEELGKENPQLASLPGKHFRANEHWTATISLSLLSWLFVDQL